MKKLVFILCVLLFSACTSIRGFSVLEDTNFTITQEGDTVFFIVTEPPQFPGGREKMWEFINENLRFPARYAEITVQGTVLVEFIVGREGLLTHIEVLDSGALSRCFEKEAIRVIEKMPKWIPGRHKEEIVSVSFALPIRFRIQ